MCRYIIIIYKKNIILFSLWPAIKINISPLTRIFRTDAVLCGGGGCWTRFLEEKLKKPHDRRRALNYAAVFHYFYIFCVRPIKHGYLPSR